MPFTENEIRPAALDEGKLAALEEDLSWLRARIADFHAAICPACQSELRVAAFDKFGFHFDACRQCGTAYMNPRPDSELLGEFYSRSALYAYWDRYIFPASREVRRSKIFLPRVERIIEICQRHSVETGVIIDVGAAHGGFCEEVIASGVFRRVIAIEPGEALAATCRAANIETIALPIEQVQSLDEPVDVVTSFENIEHLADPAGFLRNCKNLLKPSGLLVLTCPNYHGFDIQTLGPLSDSLDAEHINMFNPQSLRGLLELCGFDVLEWSTPGELDADIVRNKALEGAIDLSNQPFLRRVLLERWDELGHGFQEYLKSSGQSSHMWMVARRIG